MGNQSGDAMNATDALVLARNKIEQGELPASEAVCVINQMIADITPKEQNRIIDEWSAEFEPYVQGHETG